LALDGRPGIDLLKGLLSGEIPAPPLSRLTGLRMVDFEAGRCAFSLPLGEWIHGPDGRASLGALTVPADAAMATAAITRLPAGVGLTTSELALRQLRPAPREGLITAHAEVHDEGTQTLLVTATLTAQDGTPVAHGSSLCVTVATPADPDAMAAGVGAVQSPPARDTDTAAADPWERPAPDHRAVPATGRIGLLTGLRIVSVGTGRATLALPATRWLCAPPPGRVQGGAIAILADAAVTAAIRTDRHGAGMRPIELKLNYLRPLLSDGREATADAQVVHAGRRIAVAWCEVRDARGRLVAVGSGSTIADG